MIKHRKFFQQRLMIFDGKKNASHILKKTKMWTPTPRCGHHRTHVHNRITQGDVRQLLRPCYGSSALYGCYLPRRVFANPFKRQIHITGVVPENGTGKTICTRQCVWGGVSRDRITMTRKFRSKRRC